MEQEGRGQGELAAWRNWKTKWVVGGVPGKASVEQALDKGSHIFSVQTLQTAKEHNG